MKSALKLRLTALAALIAGLTVASVWSVATGWRQVAELSEGLWIAEYLEPSVVDLKDQLYHAELAADEATWQRFLEKSRALSDRIREQRPLLKTKRERDLMNSIASGYARYLSAAEAFVPEAGPGRLSDAEHERVVGLRDQLNAVRREGVGQFLADSHRSIGTLQKVNLTLLTTTAALAGWLLVTAYRGILVPLRRQLDETGAALEHAQKLASLGVLASGVAHEIRNPLTAIKARLYTHQKLLAKGTPEHTDCDFIGEEISRLERIVREFLQFARPSDPVLAGVSPANLLRDVAELLAPELARSSVALAVGEAAGIDIHADAHQIKQVLINLIRNASESIGRGGQITLRARETRLAGGGQRAVSLEVEDTGKGIPADVQKRLFDPFFTTKPSGTGLGLSIAARIVEKHGGALEFDTQPGRGTTFRIILPIERPA